MQNDDARLFPSLAWSRFNSDFRIPESDDAARVANEVKASVDTWIQNSLQKLEQDMNQRAQLAASQLGTDIAESRNQLNTIQNQIADIHSRLSALAVGDQKLKESVDALVQKTQDARDAMRQAADTWENRGRNAMETLKTIAGTVAKFA